MWLKTTENTLVNSRHVARFSISGTIVYAELPHDLDQGKASGPTVASCQSGIEALAVMDSISRSLALKIDFLDINIALASIRGRSKQLEVTS